jgi:hypothetical protein
MRRFTIPMFTVALLLMIGAPGVSAATVGVPPPDVASLPEIVPPPDLLCDFGDCGLWKLVPAGQNQ